MYNPCNLYSYAVGRTRALVGGDPGDDGRSQIISADRAEAMLVCGTCGHPYLANRVPLTL